MGLAGAKNVLAVLLVVVGYLGQQLVWFQGDATAGDKADVANFQIFVANLLFAAAIALQGSSKASAVLKTIGFYFFAWNVERAVCLLPPHGGGSNADYSGFETKNAYRTAYVGAVTLLISTFLGFALSFLNLLEIPAGLGGRIGSIRGIAFLLAVCTSILVSFIAFSYDYVCGNGNPRPDQTQQNARPILFAFVFLSAVVVGDAQSFNLSVFLASIGVLIWKPIFDSRVDWSDSNFHDRWRTQESLAFSGFVILLVGVVVEKAKGGLAVKVGLQTVVDVAALGLGIAGAVSAFTKNQNDLYTEKLNNYYAAFAIVITAQNFLAGLLGLDALAIISTYFTFYVLKNYDVGSETTSHFYFRGGLQLCQSAVLVSTFFKVFTVAKIQEGELTKIINDKNQRVAAFFLLSWATVGALRVPTEYSKFFLISIITFGALTQNCKNWARTTFHIVGLVGATMTFPLRNSTGFDYIDLVVFLAAVSFLKLFQQDFDAAGAPALGATSEDAPKEANAEPAA